jgi:transmembrane sensor
MDFDPEILDRFFNGTFSRKDYFKLRSVFRNLEYRSKLTQYLEKHWNDFSSSEMPPGNVDHILDKIYHEIRLEENSSRRISFFSVFQKVAAILIIPLLLFFFAVFYFKTGHDTDKAKESTYKSIDYTEIQCPLGVRTEFQLPDRTKGFLNSGSRLRYPVRFSGGRHVTVSGEAYFDVTPDKQNPFIVSTSNLNITVTYNI